MNTTDKKITRHFDNSIDNSVFSEIRIRIFKLIQSSKLSKLQFNRLKEELNIESNDLSYHLKILIKSGLIEKIEEKDNSFYFLSQKGKIIYPYLPIITNEEKPLFVVCCVALIKDDIIYFQKKPREPEKGALVFFGGKVLSGKDIELTLIDYTKEQAGCKISNLKLRCINEFIKKNSQGDNEFHNLVYFYTGTPIGTMNSELISKELSKLNYDELFWDNKFFIKEMLYNKTPKITRTIL